MTNPPTILYIGSTLPALSETFVWREVLALRARGVDVRTASVHPPDAAHGDPRLDALARESIPVYGAGAGAVARGALSELASRPARTLRTLGRGLADAALSRDLPRARRPRVLWQCLAAVALARRVRPLGVRHIHAHMAHVPTTIAMYAAAQLGIPFSFTGHANDLYPGRTLLAEKLRRAAFVACISRWHRGFYRSIAPVPEPRLPIIRCGVDTAEFAPPAPVERASPPASREPPTILAVGRLIPKKGFDLLLHALAALARDGLNVRAVIVGDGPERSSLASLAAGLGIADSVEFLGARANSEVRRLMAAADLFVLPCRTATDGDRDGIPVALMEAMACGLCTVAGDLPTIRELIEHGSTGLLSPPDDPGALARTLAAAIRDPDLRADLGRRGRAHVEREFDLALNADRLINAFESVLGPVTPPPRSPEERRRMTSTAAPPRRRYLLITPCRDEAEFLPTTIDAVARQTVPPAKWIIVDDGSNDETPEILARAAAEHGFIEVVRRPDRGRRRVGPGVIEAFYDGLSRADLEDYDYVCKFDADLDLPPRYFEALMERFEADPCLGTLSGKLFLRHGDRLIEERCGDENSVGPAKFYRTRCFREIGGFVREVSWDGIDGHLCRMNGWIAASTDHPDLRIIHCRRMGSSEHSFWTGRLRWGRGKYYMGSAPWYVLAASAYRMAERPYVISGLGILAGYLQALARRGQRYENAEYRRFHRRYELRSLLLGKRRATRRLNDRIRAARSAADPHESRRHPPPAGAGAARPAAERLV